MLVDKKDYIKALIDPIKSIRRKVKIKKIMKSNLLEYDFYPGDIEVALNNPEYELPLMKESKLFLLGEQIYLHTKNENIDPSKFFTEPEMKKARQYSGKLEHDAEIELPFILENVIYLGRGRYLTYLSAKTIKELMDARLIEYNFDVQREAEKVVVNGEVKKKPKINKQNIREIKEHLKDGTLEPTQIVLNAAIRTAESGNELSYDPEKNNLIINKGTRLDIVDGFHRCTGTQLALEEDPNIDYRFTLLLTNYSDEQAKRYQAQFAKATQISNVRQRELQKETYGDVVVDELKVRSELKNKISQSHRANFNKGELVSYDVLVDAINESFKMETKADSYDVSDYLVEFFDYLIGRYKKEFIDEPKKISEESLINVNAMFAGYIKLASRMFEQDIQARDLKKYIDKIDFNRSNKVWKDIDVLDDKGSLKDKKITTKNIMEYFNTIEL